MFSARMVVGSIALSLGGAAFAQGVDAQRIRIGEAELYPSLRIEYVSDDNIARFDDQPVEGDAVVVRPVLNFRADRRQIRFGIDYVGAYSNGSEPALDWADHLLDANVNARLGVRRLVQANVFLARRHEAPGQNVTRGRRDLVDTPVEYNDIGVRAAFTFGAALARGNVSAGLRYDNRRFTNLDQVTDGLDYTSVEPFARFGYRLGGTTRLFTELSFRDVAYDAEQRDFSGPALSGGLLFAATGALEGELRIGVRDIDFASPDAEDGPELVLFGGVDYSPSTLTTLSLDLQREIDNATSFAGAGTSFEAINTEARLTWERDWSARFSTSTFGAVELQERDCPSSTDTITRVGLEGQVSVRRWLQVGANVLLSSRTADPCSGQGDADTESEEFDRQVVGAFVTVTL